METIQYHALRIDYEPQQAVRDVPAGCCDYWFNIYDEDDQTVFRLRMRVDSVYAHFNGGDVNALAKDLGLLWVRGLVDLGRFTRGETYFETRDGDWNPSFGTGSVSDERLRVYLLDAAERVTRVEMRTGRIEGIDILGIANVLGVPLRMVQDELAGLLLEGLVESWGATYGRDAVGGACRITEDGARTLRMARERGQRSASQQRALHAVLFTDIIKSTGHLAELGDDEWGHRLERHYRESGSLVEQFGGRVVNHTGDGILALFDMPSQALECALGIRSRLADIDIEIRAAVHFGEVSISDDDVGGMTIHVASRVLRESQGEVLTTEAVREIALGSRVQFAHAGERELRDVQGPWLLYEASIGQP